MLKNIPIPATCSATILMVLHTRRASLDHLGHDLMALWYSPISVLTSSMMRVAIIIVAQLMLGLSGIIKICGVLCGGMVIMAVLLVPTLMYCSLRRCVALLLFWWDLLFFRGSVLSLLSSRDSLLFDPVITNKPQRQQVGSWKLEVGPLVQPTVNRAIVRRAARRAAGVYLKPLVKDTVFRERSSCLEG